MPVRALPTMHCRRGELRLHRRVSFRSEDALPSWHLTRDPLIVTSACLLSVLVFLRRLSFRDLGSLGVGLFLSFFYVGFVSGRCALQHSFARGLARL